MANKKILITLLGLAVLLQLSFATPVPDSDSKSSEESKESKDDLEKYAILEFSKVAANVVPKEVEVLKEVVQDLKADEKRTDSDNEVIKQIEEFVKEVDDAEKDDSKAAHGVSYPLSGLFRINAIVDPYDEVGEPSKKNPKVHDLLEKHGWRKVRDSFDAEIEPKIDELGKKVKGYLNGLSESERKEQKSIRNWVAKFDDKENDIGDKINLLLEFIAVVDDSNESKSD